MTYMHIFKELFNSHKCLESCRKDILRAFNILKRVYAAGGKVLLCGNGGSAADCEHIVGELMKGFRHKRPVPEDFKLKLEMVGADGIADYIQGALPAISLVSQNSLITAFSNDVSYDYAFAQQVFGYGKPGDAIIAISTSGNAVSVINACRVAMAIGMEVIGLTGESGGLLREFCDVCIRVPFKDTETIQENHLPVYHSICAALESEFYCNSSYKEDLI